MNTEAPCYAREPQFIARFTARGGLLLTLSLICALE